MHLLVTGSRHWTDREQIRHTLDAAFHALGDGTCSDALPLLIHGGNGVVGHHPDIDGPVYTADPPRGADAIADQIWRSWGLPVRIYWADWTRHGRRAGPYRNQAMVDTAPDLVCAFRLDHSRGTTDCIRRAEAAGLRLDVIDRHTTTTPEGVA